WTGDLWCLHSAAWWRRHWDRTGLMDVELADSLPDGWRSWLDWLELIAPENVTEIEAITADAGSDLGYVCARGRRPPDVEIPEPVVSVPTQYANKPMLRGPG